MNVSDTARGIAAKRSMHPEQVQAVLDNVAPEKLDEALAYMARICFPAASPGRRMIAHIAERFSKTAELTALRSLYDSLTTTSGPNRLLFLEATRILAPEARVPQLLVYIDAWAWIDAADALRRWVFPGSKVGVCLADEGVDVDFHFLNGGAWDYVVVGTSPDESLARLKALVEALVKIKESECHSMGIEDNHPEGTPRRIDANNAHSSMHMSQRLAKEGDAEARHA